LVVLALVAGTSCARQMGRKASEGAIEALKQRPASEQPMRVAAGRAVEGAIDKLEDPRQQERLREIIGQAVDAAVARTFQSLADPRQRQNMNQLVTELVDEATERALQNLTAAEPGPLAGLEAMVQRLASVAAHEVVHEVVQGMNKSFDELLPSCEGLDPAACRHQRLRALTRETGASFAAGVLDVVRWPLLIATGLLGLVTGLLAHWLWTLRGRPAAGAPGPRPAPAPSRAATQS
jgi:hypothetical protein